MSSQAARPWLAATSRCSIRPQRSLASVSSIRRYTQPVGEEEPLETAQSWSQFQSNRADYKTLVDTFGSYGSTQTRENTFQPHHSLHRPTHPSQTTLSALVAAGAHFGHSKSLLNPNFLPYAYGERADITIIDMDHTLPLLRRAAKVVRGVAAKDGLIVFVGTRPDLRAVVRKAAERMGSRGYHVGERWLPGTLTNRMKVLAHDPNGDERIIPDLVIFLNPTHNIPALRECASLHVPTIGIIDSNVDPRIVMYPIPANDESTRTAELICGVLSVAGREGVALAEEEVERQKEKLALIRKMQQKQRQRDSSSRPS